MSEYDASAEKQWLQQIDNANRNAKTALTALTIFTSVFLLTAITNIAERTQVYAAGEALKKQKQELDQDARWIYEIWTDNYKPAQQAKDLKTASTTYATQNPADSNLSRAQRHLSQFENWFNIIVALKSQEKDRPYPRSFEELDLTQRGYLCSLELMDQYFHDPVSASERNALTRALGVVPKIDAVKSEYRITSPETLKAFGYPTDADPAGTPFMASDSNGYANLSRNIDDSQKKFDVLKTASVTFPLINFSVNLASIGVAGLIANLGILVYLAVVVERLRSNVANVLACKPSDSGGFSALVSDFPLVGVKANDKCLAQALAVTVPALSSFAYFNFDFFILRGGAQDAVMNPRSDIGYALTCVLLVYFAFKIKKDSQAIAEAAGVRDCLFTGEACGPSACAKTAAHRCSEASNTGDVANPVD